MIIGTLLRNIKTYSGINYIPLTTGEKFCGLVGNNGIGKSSVLEALDWVFNNKSWNYNTTVKKGGLATTRPHVVPIFLIPKKDISDANAKIASELSEYAWTLTESDLLGQYRANFKVFAEQRELLFRSVKKDELLLIPLGVTHDNVPSLSIFNNRKLGEVFVKDFDIKSNIVKDDDLEIFKPIFDELKAKIDYIYIPKDIDPEHFTQLENREIQSLMGETLTQILERTVTKTQIETINKNLNAFITELSNVLTSYSFRTITDRQQNIRKNDVYAMIIEGFFKIRKLHKLSGEHWLEISSLSSGEKQKAIIDIASYLLNKYRKNTENIILAIDEPEASLHMSACFDQFQTLAEMSGLCMQLLFTTHWYGFIPTTEKGCVCLITKTDEEHKTDLINIAGYREEVKQTVKDSKGKLPYDIRLKSINDFIQSVITSMLSDDPYNWLIVEGSSEKLYFEKYLADIIAPKKLRIIPVGGAAEIKRIYNNLAVAYDDFRKEVKGIVLLISDTDSQIVSYPTKIEFPNLKSVRLINNDATFITELVKIDSNNVSPKTEIEDCLNGKIFYETLCTFQDAYPELGALLDGLTNVKEISSYYALDISPRKQAILDGFFNRDNNKYKFAEKYVAHLTSKAVIPEWILKVKETFETDKKSN